MRRPKKEFDASVGSPELRAALDSRLGAAARYRFLSVRARLTNRPRQSAALNNQLVARFFLAVTLRVLSAAV